jgi:hypothetical protein
VIVSASYRTDLPALYGTWFLARLEAGFCEVRNPYGGQVSVVDLTRPAVDAFVFWTRNLQPFMGALERVAAQDWPFVVQYTVTGYPRVLETAVPPASRSVELMRETARRYGPRVVVWRYDPILFSSVTPAEHHRRRFAELAARLEGITDEVVVSFAQIYRKTRRNLDALAAGSDFAWEDPEPERKQELLVELAAEAHAHGMALSLCAQRDLLLPGVADAACVDPRRLSDVAGRPIAAAARGHRKACGCSRSVDIGAYESCTLGCVYCYAVQDRRAALAHRRGLGRQTADCRL